MSLRKRVLRSASVDAALMDTRYLARSDGPSSTREQVLQMFCRISMTAFRKPMWKTGSSSVMWPKWPAHSDSLRPHVPHWSALLEMPRRGSRQPCGAGARWGILYSSREHTCNDDARIMSRPDMVPNSIAAICLDDEMASGSPPPAPMPAGVDATSSFRE